MPAKAAEANPSRRNARLPYLSGLFGQPPDAPESPLYAAWQDQWVNDPEEEAALSDTA